jgi:serine/threonine protein kinase
MVSCKCCSGCVCEVKIHGGRKRDGLVSAVPLGYLADRLDVFACGACLSMMAWATCPWRRAKLDCPHFQQLFHSRDGPRKAINRRLTQWCLEPLSAEFMDLFYELIRFDPEQRITAKEALAMPCFQAFRANVPEADLEMLRANITTPGLLTNSSPAGAAAQEECSPRAEQQEENSGSEDSARSR